MPVRFLLAVNYNLAKYSVCYSFAWTRVFGALGDFCPLSLDADLEYLVLVKIKRVASPLWPCVEFVNCDTISSPEQLWLRPVALSIVSMNLSTTSYRPVNLRTYLRLLTGLTPLLRLITGLRDFCPLSLDADLEYLVLVKIKCVASPLWPCTA